MRHGIALFLLLWTASASAAPTQAPALDVKAEAILNRIDDLYRGEASKGILTMRVSTEHWKRTLQLEFYNKGKDQSLIRILSPKKEKGTATLRVKKDMWNYLPKVKRVIKVPVTMMGGSWMGSHFTNDDLVKQSRMADDFTYQVTFEGERKGRDIREVTCIAREDAAVVWGKVVVEVLAKDSMPVAIRYYDEDMELTRTMEFGEFKTFGSRHIPALMKIVPKGKPGEFTEVRYDKLDFDAVIPDSTFSRRQLER